MSLLETIHVSHLPLPVHIGLYKDLRNAPSLRKELLSQNSDFEYAFIDATMVRETII
jgi:EKC/KEOPS complex subunit CGI121/TPRKB